MAKKSTNPNKLARRNSRGRPEKQIAEYQSLNADGITKLIDAVTALGGTVTFGLTRDKGAYYLGFYLDGESSKAYIRPDENADEYIAGETDWWLSD